MTMFTLYLWFPSQGKMFARRVLSKCWDGILDVLSVLLNGKSSCGISSSLGLLLGTEGAKEESLRAQEAICTSLNGLQKAARLCCTLGTVDSLLYTSTYCNSAIKLYFSESIKLWTPNFFHHFFLFTCVWKIKCNILKSVRCVSRDFTQILIHCF